MINRNKYYILFIVSFTLFLTYLHHSFFQAQSPHIVLEELYYIPLLLGALIFGLKGAILSYVFVSLLYLPYFFGHWATSFLGLIDRMLHLLFTGVSAFLAGFFVDRQRKRQKQLERDRYLAGIGQMAATIVHDLKSPLIAILGFARRIKEGKKDVDTAAQTIIDSTENMQKIVNGVLDFSRPIQLNLKPDDIRNVVNHSLTSCKMKSERGGVILSVDIPVHPVSIVMDNLHVQRALINVINNAIEASNQGQNVFISLRNEKNNVVIRIKDFGTGVDKETLENIFIPFYSKKDEGTGLGMAIARKIVEGHKGTIHVKSRPGLGTEVIIELPYRS